MADEQLYERVARLEKALTSLAKSQGGIYDVLIHLLPPETPPEIRQQFVQRLKRAKAKLPRIEGPPHPEKN